MAGIYDIHCHLNDNMFLEQNINSTEMVKTAKRAGVSKIFSVGYDVKSSKVAVLQAAKNNEVYAVVGIHPTQAHLFTNVAYDQIDTLLNANKVVAVGETGLDYSKGKKYIEEQKHSFFEQIQLAKRYDLPLMLHIRDEKGKYDAYLDVLEILKSNKIKKAVIHSFEGSLEIAKKFVNEGYYISFSGLLTTEKHLEEVAKTISINKIMIESDAPYNAPIPYENKVNQPQYVAIVAERLATLRNIGKDDVASATSDNAKKLFNI